MPNDVLLQLGGFQFSVSTAAYEHLVRVGEYRWATMPRINHRPSLQWIGLGIEEIELTGTIYPHYKGGLRQVDGMRTLAQSGKPQILVTGIGDHLGQWCILSIDEKHVHVWFHGAPLKQEFALRLRNFGPEQDAPGWKAFLQPSVTTPGVVPILPEPPDIGPLQLPAPANIPLAQLTPMAPAFQAAGMTVQQGGSFLQQGLQALRQVQQAVQTVTQALAAAKYTYSSLQKAITVDPLGTMINLLTVNGGLTAAGLTALFGPDLAPQMAIIGAAIQITQSTAQTALSGARLFS